MTQEIIDKAKAYDEAIEKAKSKIKNDKDHVLYEDDIIEIFPELAESEDERIRKDIIWCLKHSGIKESGPINPHVTTITRDAIAWLEKQTEQKPTDKVKPKFKVGDWVINTITKEVEQVIELTDCEYICSGHLIVSFNNQHLLKGWTIQDAKDSDVLAINNKIFIYAHRKQMYSIASAQCFVDSAGGFYLDGEFGYTEKGNSIHPATKEQREQLEKAMADAGYTFDFEKKELKKIEQTPAWSEDDKCMLNNVIDTLKPLNQTTHSGYAINSMIAWLKSLRPQNTWKPSDEQMKALNAINVTGGISYAGQGQELINLYNDLKTLKVW